MEKLEITGGARIGMANASWPFATLRVNKDKLELNASIVGNLIFQPKDIISIESYNKFTFLGKGLKINHRIANYDSEVIFWTFRDPLEVINQIRETGFFDNTKSAANTIDTITIQQQQQTGGFPIKKNVAIAIVVIWNLLFIADYMGSTASDKKTMPIGTGMTIAVAALLLVSVLTLKSKDFSKLILKEGKEIGDIKKFLYFLILFFGFMLFIVLISKLNNKNY
jgi:hypothetical protein